MGGQIAKEEKSRRLHTLSDIEADIRLAILENEIEAKPIREVLLETWKDGIATGHTDDFLEVCVPTPRPMHAYIVTVKITSTDGNMLFGEII